MAKSYWRKREEEHARQRVKDEKKQLKRLMKKHDEAIEEIEEQIAAFYGRYASKEGITVEEARKRVAKADIKKYRRKAKKYVKEKDFSKRANEEMRLYNVTMRINRLQLLKANINLELVALTNEEAKDLEEALTELARKEYERMSAILGYTVQYKAKDIKELVDSSFLTANWSERIWDNQDALRSELDRLISRGIVQGKGSEELARDLRKTFNKGIYNTERLMVTEMTRVETQVHKNILEDAGIEEYEFIAKIDSRTSDECRRLDGKVFKVKDLEYGENAPPVHPNCRSSIAPHIDRDEWEKELKERGL